MARGTDVHPYYQRGLNWKAAPDIHFVWVKVSDGGSAYSTVQQGVKYVPDTHVAGAKAAGLPVGGYHYAQLGPAAEAQADILVREVRRLGATGVAPMLDLETPFTPNAAAKDFAIRFCNRVAAAGFRPAVYMSASFAKVLRPDQWGIPGLVIVIARYGAVPEAPGSAQYLGRYDVHQYSSSGSLPGSAGAVDLDDSRNNNHLTQGDDMLDDERSALFAIRDSIAVAKTSKVPGSNAAYTAEEFGRFTNAAVYNLVTKTLPDLLAAVLATDANDVTADSLAAALAPALLPQLEQGLRDAVTNLPDVNLTAEQITAIANAAADSIGVRIVNG